PAKAIAAPAQNALTKPSVSALGTAVPLETALSVVETAIVERIAIPTAPPICCEVLIRPEARPAYCGFVPASAAIVIGTNANGIAAPRIRKPGKRSAQYEPPTDTWVKARSPTVSMPIPKTSVGLTPTRFTIHAATLAQMM